MPLAPKRHGLRPAIQLPEPDRLWIRYAPRRWPAAPPDDGSPGSRFWLDLAKARPGTPGTGEPPEIPDGPFDDVVYVPPIDARRPEARERRDRAVGRIVADGTPVVVHLGPGDPPPPEGVLAVVELLDTLLAGDLKALGTIPPGAAVAWPLVEGLTDRENLREEGLDRLAGAGVSVVQPVVPELSPEDRRSLAAGRDEGVFDALFHGPPPDGRRFARAAARRGLGVFLPRPLPRPPLRGASQRELGGLLLLAGDLCQRLGWVGRGQAHFRAARWVDRTRYDLRVLAREGNLSVIHWLDGASREIVEEWAETGRSKVVKKLVEEWVGGEEGPGDGEGG